MEYPAIQVSPGFVEHCAAVIGSVAEKNESL